MSLTPAQIEARDTRGVDLLVSAAAGSGKTFTLSERVKNYVQSGYDLGRLLIVTFTVDAAGEMRARIGKALEDLCREHPDQMQCRKAKFALNKAKICTIDSYGMDLLKRYFTAADLSPDFSVMDDTELAREQHTVYNLLFVQHYTEFHPLVQLLGRDDPIKKIYEVLIDLCKELDSLPDPDAWIEERKRHLGDEDLWIRGACEEMKIRVSSWVEIFDACAFEFPEDSYPLYDRERALLHRLSELLGNYQWEDAVELSAPIFRTNGSKGDSTLPFDGRVPSAKNSPTKDAKNYREARKNIRDSWKNTMLSLHRDDLIADRNRVAEGLTQFLELAQEFRAELMKRMARKNRYTFAALSEKVSLLLQNSVVAQQEQSLYDEIMIDEYQDVSDRQDALFNAISNGHNLFCVGDVKQAIYGFRGSNPKNFLEKKRSFRTIPLNENFRSSQEILSFANFVCGRMFSESVGDVNYTAEEELHYGRDLMTDGAIVDADPFPSGYEEFLRELAAEREDGTKTMIRPFEKNPKIELFLSPYGENSDESCLTQARLAAALIRKTVSDGSATVFDKDAPNHLRPMHYGDIAVLLRDNKDVKSFAQVLSDFGIPYKAGDDHSFPESVSVNNLIAVLSAIDNPRRDSELFIALSSDVFGFTESELAALRSKGKEKPFLYDDLLLSAKNGNAKAENAIHRMESWRILSRNLEVSDVISEILTETNFAAKCSSVETDARAMLNDLYQFSLTCHGSLAEFLKNYRAVQEDGKKYSSAESKTESGKLVTLLTMHKSKGLEYPWVILPRLEKMTVRNSGTVRLDADLGIACDIVDLEDLSYYSSFMSEVAKLRQGRKEASERLRLFYVALTRPRDRLTIIGKDDLKSENKATVPKYHGPTAANGMLYPETLLGDSMLHLLLSVCRRHPDAKLLSKEGESPVSADFPLRVAFLKSPEGQNDSSVCEVSCGLTQEELTRRFTFSYDTRYAFVPAKVAVTELSARMVRDPDAEPLIDDPVIEQPEFLEQKKISAARRGTLMHRFCQTADFSKDVVSEIDRMKQLGIFSDEEADALDVAELEALKNSSVGKRIALSTDSLREFPFVCAVPASYYTGNSADTKELLLQGVIDLLLPSEDGMSYHLVDYKTDRASVEELKERYLQQMKLYVYALKTIGKSPNRVSLWSFYNKQEINITKEVLK